MKPSAPNKIFNEACYWVARLRSGAVSQADKACFSRWLNSDCEHETAFDSAIADWQILGTLAHTETAKTCFTDPQPTSVSGFFSQWVFQWQGAAFASIALLAVLSTSLLQPSTPNTPDTTQHFATVRGEHRLIALSDGSEVNLNTDSEIHIDYSDKIRNLTLIKGEAFFKVASNRVRPFVVDVGDGTVTAVGTAFGIKRTTENVSVTVIEGIVSVKEHDTQPQIKPETRTLKADEGLIIDKRGLSTVIATNAMRALAWRDQLLVLENQSLPVALAELNRYLKHPVDPTHPSLANLKVSGTFSLQTPEATLTALVTTFDLAQDNSGAQPRLYARSE